MDNFYCAHRFVGAGFGEQLHNGWVYSHPAPLGHYQRPGQHHSGPQNRVTLQNRVNSINLRKGLVI